MLKLYWKYFSIHLQSEMAYPGSFFLSCVGRMLLTISTLLGIHVMMWRFGTLGDYNLGQILLGYGVVVTGFHLAECFARGFDAFGQIIRKGTFDLFLIRPAPLIFQVICQDTRMASLPNIFLSLGILIRGAYTGGIHWNLPKVLVLISMVLCGALLFFGAFLVYASICFHTLEGLEIMNIFTDGIRNYSRYPYDVYGKGVLWITTVIMPMAMVQYWPLQYLIGKGNWIFGLFPLLSLLFLVPCYMLWKSGVRHYCSSGS